MPDKLKLFDVTVEARAEPKGTMPAQLCCCPDCPKSGPKNPTLWIIYVVKGHVHTQCDECGATYCQGDCA